MTFSFKIENLDINQSYFKGKVSHQDERYTINIQTQRRGKVLKLPTGFVPKKDKVGVRLTGPTELVVEDYIPYCGKSEWVEIDSDEITFFIADHQDQLDLLEVIDDPFV